MVLINDHSIWHPKSSRRVSIPLPFLFVFLSHVSLAGHGKPVDVWAMGVITYFLLAGYTPFDRESQQQEMEAIIAGDYKFEPEEYWQNVSETAKDFVRTCLTLDPVQRPTAAQALQHKVLLSCLYPSLVCLTAFLSSGWPRRNLTSYLTQLARMVVQLIYFLMS